MMHVRFTPLSIERSVVNTFFVPHYLCSTTEFGSQLALVTMTIEVALAGGRRVCFRLRQTEKERSVTVINVLAETETVDSQGLLDANKVLRSMMSPKTIYTRARRHLITII